MIKIKNNLGEITITLDVLENIVGNAANSCFGVVEMAGKNTAENFISLVMKDRADKGVKITKSDDKMFVEIHIAIPYGVNLHAVTDSITEKVKYALKEAVSIVPADITISVDRMKV